MTDEKKRIEDRVFKLVEVDDITNPKEIDNGVVFTCFDLKELIGVCFNYLFRRLYDKEVDSIVDVGVTIEIKGESRKGRRSGL